MRTKTITTLVAYKEIRYSFFGLYSALFRLIKTRFVSLYYYCKIVELKIILENRVRIENALCTSRVAEKSTTVFNTLEKINFFSNLDLLCSIPTNEAFSRRYNYILVNRKHYSQALHYRRIDN